MCDPSVLPARPVLAVGGRLFEDAPVAILETDAQGTIRRANRAACKLAGRGLEEILGRPESDFAPWSVGHRASELALCDAQGDPAGFQVRFLPDAGTEPPADKARQSEAGEVSIEAAQWHSIQFQQIWENTIEGIRLTDAQGTVVLVNPAYCRIVGKARSDIEGQSLSAAYDESLRKRVEASYRRRFAARSFDQREERAMKLSSGRRVWVETTNTYLEQEGLPPLLLTTYRDVSERKRDEQALLVERNLAFELAQARTLMEAASACLDAAIRVSGTDCGGFFLADKATGDLVLTHDRGLTEDLRAATGRYPADSDWPRPMAAGKTVYCRADRPNPLLGEAHRREGLRSIAMAPVARPGRPIACFYVASHSADEIPPSGRHALETIAAQVGNVLTRLLAEQELDASREESELLFDSVQDFLFVLDGDGRILRVNSAALARLGYAPEDVLGRTLTDLHPPEKRRRAEAALREALAGGPDYYSIPWQARDGSLIPAETRLAVRRTFWIDRAFGVSRDRSERIRGEEALLRRERWYRQHARRGAADGMDLRSRRPVHVCEPDGRGIPRTSS